MDLFRRIFLAALLAGLLGGMANAAIQQWRLVPLIIAAEAFEHGAVSHTHDDGTTHANQDQHADAWAPADGFERTAYTIAATILLSIGFALTIGAVAVITDLPITPVNGLIWGLGGFAVFSLAPSLGLPPELPGMAAADLDARQFWWWTAALTTGAGAIAIAKWRNLAAIVIGGVLILSPHLTGAPAAPGTTLELPAELASAFAANALGAALVFWLICGVVYGWMWQKNPFGDAR